MTDPTPFATAERAFADHERRDLSAGIVSELCRGLFSLDAFLRAYIEREERFLLPRLDEDTVQGAGGGRNQ